MSRSFVFLRSILALLVSVPVTGCSLINYSIGSSIDAHRTPRLQSGTPRQVVGLGNGARVLVRRNDGTSVAGVYEGLVPAPDSAYVARYDAWRDTAQVGFRPPAISTPVRVGRVDASRHTKGAFLGFGPHALHVARTSEASDGIPFEKVKFLHSDSTTVTGESLRRLESTFPVQAIARIREGTTVHQIDLLDPRIAGIEYAAPTRLRTVGLIIGLAFDVTILVGAAALVSGLR